MPPKPPVFRTLTLALSDTLSAAKALPAEFAICFLTLLISELLFRSYFPGGQPLAFGMVAFGFANALVTGAIFAPFAVLIHRRIILGEQSGFWSLPALGDRIGEFYVVTVGLQLGFVLATALMAVSAMLGLGALGLILAVIGFLALMYVFMRLLLLFPAIAVDGPHKDLAGAFKRSRGLVWRCFAATLLLTLPWMLAQKIVVALAGRASPRTAEVVGTLSSTFGTLILTAATIAIASRYYVWRRDVDTPEPPMTDGLDYRYGGDAPNGRAGA